MYEEDGGKDGDQHAPLQNCWAFSTIYAIPRPSMVTACFDIARVQLSEEGGDLAAKRSGQVVVACSARRMRECREGRVVCGS
jgi:hypothetical protein